MSWATQVHKKRAKEEKRKKEIVQDGKIFYDVFIIASCRIWKDRTLRIKKDPDDFVTAVASEMAELFANPGDYEAMRIEETGIDVKVI